MAKEEGEVFEEDFNILDGLDGLEESLGTSTTQEQQEEEPEQESSADDKDGDDTKGSDEESQDAVDKEKEDTDSDQQEQTTEKSSPLTPYAKYLKEEGVLPNLDIDGFDGTVDALKQAFIDEVYSGVEEYKSMLPPEVKSIIDNYEAGVPLDTLIKINSEVVKYNSITDEQLADSAFQKQIYTEFLTKTTRFSKERIDKEVNRLAELQELEEVAKDAIQDLIVLQKEEEAQAVEQAKKDQAAFEVKRTQDLENLKTTIESTKEVIPGVEIPKTLKDKIFKNLTVPAAYDASGNPMNKLGAYRAKNPIQTEIILNYLFEATNEFKDWSAFGKAVKSKVFKEIEKAASMLDNKPAGSQQGRKQVSATTKSFLEDLDTYMN